ncbi:MAG: cytochrome o ubiquinol oxidase subunit IV [Candidatus Doudnabacteria bacterium]|nr:cytochrome o ubiquinol oxidase subunit IV [Candidatus Doudnabacteria bacterium]
MQEHKLSPLKSYILGFFISVGLTLTAYFIVEKQLLNGYDLILVIFGLAFIQLWVQLIFFLHLGQEQKPRWNIYALLSTGGIALIVIVGSIWIMKNLNYHVPSNEDIMHEERIYK